MIDKMKRTSAAEVTAVMRLHDCRSRLLSRHLALLEQHPVASSKSRGLRDMVTHHMAHSTQSCYRPL